MSLTATQIQALLDGPAAQPPAGTIPNLVNPPNELSTGRAVSIATLVLCTLALILRLYTKAYVIRKINAADYAIVLAWGSFIGCVVSSLLTFGYSAGSHQWNVRLRDFTPYIYYFHIGAIMYGITQFFIKLSILLQYIQIFVPLKKRTTTFWICQSLIWTNFTFYLLSTFLEIIPCIPIAKAWNPLIKDGHCINTLVLNVAASSINAFSDITILILPQIGIWRLQMALKRKMQISAIFLLAVFAIICSLVRLGYSVKVFHSTDFTYYFFKMTIWSLPELAVGIIVACLPVFGKLAQKAKENISIGFVGSSISSLFRFSIFTNRGDTSDESQASSREPYEKYGKAPRVKTKSYKEVPDHQSLGSLPHDVSINSYDGTEEDQRGHYIMRTIDIEAQSGPKTHRASFTT